MPRKFGGDSAEALGATETADCRSMALALMSMALAHLDSDCNIPPIVGAQLQTAIDALWASASRGQCSIHLH